MASLYSVDGSAPIAGSAEALSDSVLSGASQNVAEGVVWHAASEVVNGAVAVGALTVAAAGVVYEGLSSDDSDDSSGISSYNLSVDVAAGNFTSMVTVKVYDQDGNLLVEQSCYMSDGAVSLSINSSYSGPILVVVSDGDYIDETTGESTSLETSLAAMTIADGSGDGSRYRYG